LEWLGRANYGHVGVVDGQLPRKSNINIAEEGRGGDCRRAACNSWVSCVISALSTTLSSSKHAASQVFVSTRDYYSYPAQNSGMACATAGLQSSDQCSTRACGHPTRAWAKRSSAPANHQIPARNQQPARPHRRPHLSPLLLVHRERADVVSRTYSYSHASADGRTAVRSRALWRRRLTGRTSPVSPLWFGKLTPRVRDHLGRA
jgi:hypothetical protein